MSKRCIGVAIAFTLNALGTGITAAQGASLSAASVQDDAAAGQFLAQAKQLEQSQDSGPLRRHYAEYIDKWGRRGGIDRLIIAQARLGELTWRAACPIPESDGLCADVQPKPHSPGEAPSCAGPRQLTLYRPHARQAPLVQEAIEHLNTALNLYASGGAENQIPFGDAATRQQRLAALQSHVATATLLLGDHGFEQLLGVQMPIGLVFDPQRKSDNRASIAYFKAWQEQKNKLLGEVQKRYQGALKLQQAASAVAAAGRIGQLFQEYAEELYNAQLPSPPPPPVGIAASEWSALFRDAYCDQLSDNAEQLAAKAVEAFTLCLDKAATLQVSGPLALRCEAALETLGRPLPAAPAVSSSGAETAGFLSQARITEAVRGHLGEVKACVETTGMTSRVQSGRVVAKWNITPSGGVDAPALESSTIQDPATEQCILATLKTWTFPRPQGGLVRTSYPFELRADQEAPAPAVDAAEVRGSLSKDLVRYSIREHINEVKACYEKGALTRKREGRILVRFMITSAGTVAAASLQSSTLDDAQTEECICAALKTWTFVKPQTGAVTVTYPFVLKSAGD